MMTRPNFAAHKILSLFVLLAASFALYSCGGAGGGMKGTQIKETIGLSIEPGWKVGHSARYSKGSITEFIREGDNINNWRELFTVHEFPTTWGASSPEDTLNLLKKIRQRSYPGSTKWNVIQKSDDRILYEWRAKPCKGWPNQHEIATIVFGKYKRFILRYTSKVKSLPPNERKKWVQILSKAKIKRTPM